MKRAILAIAFLGVACASARHQPEEPSTVPPPQPISATSPSVESQIANLQTSLTELLDRLDVLNARIAKVESGGQAPPPVQAPSGQPRAAVLHAADVAESYRRALMLYGQSKFADARSLFQRVFDADPTGSLADNALFWIGETYYVTGDYSSAMRYYERVMKEYATENKAPDAMLKLGFAFEKTGDLGMARRTFEECMKKYPYASAAASAKQELQRIKY